ncbi:hypothetical protein C3495_05840 [Clostridiaceae bacterium 14S0207]|nr:hypothetical protein C3495_05840 [Clostridiaceae bacterium 14S0207]
MELTINNLERCFYEASKNDKKYVALKLSGYKNNEILIIQNADFDSRFYFIKQVFNKELALGFIKIVGFTYGDTFEEIEKDLLG